MFKKLEPKQKLFSRFTFFLTITFALIGIGAAVIYFAPISKAVSATPRFTSLYATGSGNFQQGTNINIQWAIAEPVPYGEWFVSLYSSAGVYYDYTVLSAGNGSNSTSFSYNLPISTAPVEGGYRAVVAYRATSSDGWISVTSSTNTFGIIAANASGSGGTTGTIPPVTVTAPTITSLTTTSSSSYKQGTNIGIQWKTASPVSSGEWFISIYSSAGVYYDYVISSVGIGSSTTAFGHTQVIATAPVGSGYRAVVAYRATANDSWTSVTSSSNTFTITAGTAPPITTTPTIKTLVAAGTGSYEQQSVVTIQWTTAQAVASGEWFVGLYSSAGVYYDNITTNIGVGTNYVNFSYTLTIKTAPVGTGYRAVVAYRANANSGWINVTSSSNTFSIIAATTTTDIQEKVEGNVVTNSLCRIVASSSDQISTAKKVAAECKKSYPLIEKILGTSPCPVLHSIEFKDFSEATGEGAWWAGKTDGCLAYINNKVINSFNTYTKDNVSIFYSMPVHELVHTVQGYTYANWPPYNLTESIATYVTYKLGYIPGTGMCDAKSTTGRNIRFSDGYECGYALLRYIERKHNPNMVKILNNAIKSWSYSDSIFPNSTKDKTYKNGLTIEQLYSLCLKEECKGGAK